MRLLLSAENRPIAIAALFVVAILLAGTSYTLSTTGNAPPLSPNYLVQQLQTGAFPGICAAGMIMIILLGHIDLSIPCPSADAGPPAPQSECALPLAASIASYPVLPFALSSMPTGECWEKPRRIDKWTRGNRCSQFKLSQYERGVVTSTVVKALLILPEWIFFADFLTSSCNMAQ